MIKRYGASVSPCSTPATKKRKRKENEKQKKEKKRKERKNIKKKKREKDREREGEREEKERRRKRERDNLSVIYFHICVYKSLPPNTSYDRPIVQLKIWITRLIIPVNFFIAVKVVYVFTQPLHYGQDTTQGQFLA